MIIDVKVPMLSESVSEGTLLEWKKKVGEAVARDEILIDIETDKVVLEVPSPQAGVLVEIVAQDGETVVADQVLHASIQLLLPLPKHLQPLLPKQPSRRSCCCTKQRRYACRRQTGCRDRC